MLRRYSNNVCDGNDNCGPVPIKVNFVAEAIGDGMMEELYKAMANGGTMEIQIGLTLDKPDTCGEDRMYAWGSGDGLGRAY